MSRWVFLNTVTDETWTVPMNPNAMSSPFLDQVTSRGARSPIDGRMRVRRNKRNVKEWTFSGVARTEEHHDALVYWSAMTDLLHVTDHYGRTFAVRIRSTNIEDRKANRLVPWRTKYTFNCLSYGVVA